MAEAAETRETVVSGTPPPVPVDPPSKGIEEQVRDMFLEAARADQAMSETFDKLLRAIETLTRTQQFMDANLKTLIMRLAERDVIMMSEAEWKAFGLKPKAARMRAGSGP